MSCVTWRSCWPHRFVGGETSWTESIWRDHGFDLPDLGRDEIFWCFWISPILSLLHEQHLLAYFDIPPLIGSSSSNLAYDGHGGITGVWENRKALFYLINGFSYAFFMLLGDIQVAILIMARSNIRRRQCSNMRLQIEYLE